MSGEVKACWLGLEATLDGSRLRAYSGANRDHFFLMRITQGVEARAQKAKRRARRKLGAEVGPNEDTGNRSLLGLK